MIESNNPEIDVNQLMERVRQEAAKIRSRDNGGLASHPVRQRTGLPTIPEISAPPVPSFSRPLDSKMERTATRLQKARGMIEVSSRIPKIFRGLFRRQGGFNRATLETLNELAKANQQLGKRMQEVTCAAEMQGQWLKTLAGQRRTEAVWMKAAGALVAEVPSLQEKIAELEVKLSTLEEARGAITTRLETTGTTLDTLRRGVQTLQGDNELSGEHLRNLSTFTTQLGEQLRLTAAREQLDHHRDQLRAIQDQFDHEAETLRGLRLDFDRSGVHLRNLQAEADKQAALIAQYTKLEAHFGRLEERQIDEATYVKGELSRHSALLHQSRSPAEGSKPEPSTAMPVPEDARRLDSFYLSFENRFRGTRSEIRKRIRFYLPILKESNAGAPGRPVLDVGCGRGEWLELLLENDLEGVGVDMNGAMVAQCRERSLTAIQAEALGHLRSLPENSQGAVTGFHIIEHLSLETLIDLTSETFRVLQPGGVAIFESPNCKNLVVGACNFNIDPTHRNPVFPETASFILETQGFDNIQLEYLSPVQTSNAKAIPNEFVELRQLLYGPQDFAVIGRKPFQK